MSKRQWRRLRRKVRNFILTAITYIMGFICMLCICAIDTDGTNIFYIGTIVSGAWLALFAWANGYME